MLASVRYMLFFMILLPLAVYGSELGDGDFTFSWGDGLATLHARDARLTQILEKVSEVTGVPIKTQRADSTKITVNLVNVTLEQLIKNIAEGSAITYKGDREIYKIVTLGAAPPAQPNPLRPVPSPIRGTSGPQTLRVPSVEETVTYTGIGAAIAWAPQHRGVWLRPLSDDAPAAKAGIRTGDLVIAIDGKSVLEFTDINKVSAAIRGPSDTVVRLHIVQEDGAEVVKDVIREMYELEPEK